MRARISFTDIVSLLFILLWTYSALSKLTDYQTFKVQLGKSPMLTSMASVLAWLVPVGELIIAYSLITRKTRLLGLYASVFLMVMFTAYIIIILNFSYYIPCSCGGFISAMKWDHHIIFNLCCSALAIVGIMLNSPRQRPKFYSKSKQSPSEDYKNLSYG